MMTTIMSIEDQERLVENASETNTSQQKESSFIKLVKITAISETGHRIRR